MSFDIHPVRAMGSIQLRADAQRQDRAATAAATGTGPGDPRAVAVETDAALAEAGPPVDVDRVRQIRRALAEGTYPLTPAKVADAMIAAKFMLSEGE